MVKKVFCVHQLVNTQVYVGISIKIIEVCNKVFILCGDFLSLFFKVFIVCVCVCVKVLFLNFCWRFVFFVINFSKVLLFEISFLSFYFFKFCVQGHF
jgi:hypothetical protein